jgi:hypothetical protein
MALAEQAYVSQSSANAFLMNSINALSSTATSSIVGMIQGTQNASDVMRSFANVILNEAVKGLVEMGIQSLKSSLLQQTGAAAAATAQTAAIASTTAAQVASTGTLTATSTASAATVATAAAPAAGLMSIATLGQAALIGGAAIIGTMALTRSLAGARQYGGPTSAGSLYRVNEKGPEMFVGSNGDQYMMPSAGGRVVPADQLGGNGPAVNIVVNNNAPGTVASASYDEQSRTVRIAVAEVANQFRTNTGPVWSAAKAGSNIQSRL